MTDLLRNGSLSLFLLILTWGIAVIDMFLSKKRKGRIVTPINLLIFGTFVSATLYFYPFIFDELKKMQDGTVGYNALFNSAQFAFRLFILDGEMIWIEETVFFSGLDEALRSRFVWLGSILYFSAPICTFGFIMSMFMSIFARIKYLFSVGSKTHVFSELNDQSLALAKDIRRSNSLFVYKHLKICVLNILAGIYGKLNTKSRQDQISSLEKEINAINEEINAKWDAKSDLLASVDKHVNANGKPTREIESQSTDFYALKTAIKEANGKKNELVSKLNKLKKYSVLHENAVQNATELKAFVERYEKFSTKKNGFERFCENLLIFVNKLFFPEIVVFAGISEEKFEGNEDLVEEARAIGAIQLKEELEMMRFRWKLSWRRITFYLISEDEERKLHQAEHLMDKYDRNGIELKMFSCDRRSELLMASKNLSKMKAYRINDIQALVYYNLYTHGNLLFEPKSDKNDEKTISVVIVGLGRYGTEMLRALSWFCQMDNHKLKINAFDADEKAKDKIEFLCPDLINPVYNRADIQGEPYYDITIHSGIDASTKTFADELKKISDASYVFVCLGTDDLNLKVATEIRAIYEGIFKSGARVPYIETVVYDSDIAKKMGITWEHAKKLTEISDPTQLKKANTHGVMLKPGSPYNILITGDLDSFYTRETLFNSEAEQKGLKAHLEWGDEEDFWKYEYNYRSSVAKAIHQHLRVQLGYDTPEFDEYDWHLIPDSEKRVLADLEHRRWNAYTRSEGYVTAEARNDIAKHHPNLVPTESLPIKVLKNDVIIN